MSLPTASDNVFPKIILSEAAAPASPSSGQFKLYVDSADHILKWKNSSGTVYPLGTALTDPMTTRGDIIIRDASNVTARLGIGSSGKVLSSDGTDVSWQTPSAGGVDNWLIEGTLFVGAHGNTNWSTFNLDAQEVYNGDVESSGAQNDEIYWDLGISGGTWDFELVHFKGSNRGIYTVSIDGSSIGTIDGYAASPAKNAHTILTGVSITAGKRRLKLKMATKNASSSNYFGTAQAWQLRRTA